MIARDDGGLAVVLRAAAAATLLIACADDTVPGPARRPDAGDDADAGASACAPGELDREGACQPAGVSACARGFEADGAQGCRAILPEGKCPEGQLAVPGEARCHAVAPCPTGPWGEIPAHSEVVYVDASYAGGDGDGSDQKPFTTVQAGVDAAAGDAVVAIASGSYAEDVVMTKPVRLWGLCPDLTEIVGSGAAIWSVRAAEGAARAEVHDLSITGPPVGVGVAGADDVLVDRVWIHDTGDWGIDVEDGEGPAGVIVTRSLVERPRKLGMFVGGSASRGEIESSVVRDVLPVAGDETGGALLAQEGSTVSVRGSLVESTEWAGVWVIGATATVDATLIRDMLPEGGYGAGVIISNAEPGGPQAQATIRGSVVERTRGSGIDIISSTVVIEDTVVRDVRWADLVKSGFGITADLRATGGGRASLGVQRALVERALEVGVLVEGSDATFEGLLVRDTQPNPVTARNGRGVEVQRDAITLERAAVTLRGSRVESSREIAVFGAGADLVLEGVAVEDTLPQEADGARGRGVHVQLDSALGIPMTLTMTSSAVRRSYEAGISLSKTVATISDTTVEDTRVVQADGTMGDGIAIISDKQDRADLARVRVLGSARAGVSSFGAVVSIDSSILECNEIHLDGEVNFGAPFAFEDLGGNACGCGGAAVACQVLSSNLMPPTPVEN